MCTVARTVLGAAVVLVLVPLWSAPAPAWSYRASVEATCTASGVRLALHFANTESHPTQAMTVTATDLQTSKSVALGSVAPGHTATGNIDTGVPSVKAGKVRVALSWTGAPGAGEQRLLAYPAFGCDPPPAVPEGLDGVTLAAVVGGVAALAW